ncbi:MAG: O-antigen ligase family protein [Anaerolineae bacterium]
MRAAAGRLATLEIWPVALVVAASIITPRALPLALGVAGLFWIVRLLAYNRFSLRTPADWPLAALALLVPVTLWATPLPDVTRPAILRLLTGLALFYAIVNWATSPTRLRSLLAGAVGSGLVLALSAPFSVEWPTGQKLPLVPEILSQRLTLLVTDTINPNVMAGTLVVLLPCGLALLLFTSRQMRWPARLLLAVAVLSIVGVLTLAQSRGSLFALGITLIVLALLRWRWGWLLLLVSAITGAIVVRALGVSATLDILTTDIASGGVANRLEIWSRALSMIQDFPFTGVGMGTFQPVAGLLYPFFLAPAGVPHAHNLFLQVAVDLGLPGLAAWTAILMLVFFAAWQVYRRGRDAGDGWMMGLGAGLLGSQVALVTHGLVDAVTWGTRPAVIVWALWGLALAGWEGASAWKERT